MADIDAEDDRRQNEFVATGAIFMALSQNRAVKTVHIPYGDDEPGNSIIVEFDFLMSPYRITVTMADE